MDEALGDLARIADFNLSRSEEWADKVQVRLLDRGDSLGDRPYSGRPLGGTLRALSVPDVQYVLFHTVGDDEVRRFGSSGYAARARMTGADAASAEGWTLFLASVERGV